MKHEFSTWSIRSCRRGAPSATQLGFTLVEVVVAMALSMVVLAAGATYGVRYVDGLANGVAADQMQTVADAARAYARDHEEAILNSLAEAPTASVSVAMLKAQGYLASSVADTNNFGQSYAIRFIGGPGGKVEGLVVTQGGETIKPLNKRRIAQTLGAGGGHIDEDSLTALRGAYGGWSRPLADFGIAAGEAELAYALFVDDAVAQGGISDLYLSRDAVPGAPHLNQMRTNLDMDGNDIASVGSLSAATAGLGTLQVEGAAIMKGPVTMDALEDSGPTVRRADADHNAVLEFAGTGGSVFSGQGDQGTFAVGGNRDLRGSTTPWMEISATGARVHGREIWHTGNFDPSSKADIAHTHSAAAITSGTFGQELIPNLDASKISTGVLDPARIPELDAGKIASGTLAIERIPNLPIGKINGLQAVLDGKLGLDSMGLNPDGTALGGIGYSSIGKSGFYRPRMDGTQPMTGADGDVIHLQAPNGDASQLAFLTHESIWFRVKDDGVSWSDWASLWHSKNFDPDSKADVSHTHAAADITSGTLAAARIPTLAISKVSGLQAALDSTVKTSGNQAVSGIKTFSSHVTTSGNSGWVNSTHGGGIYMSDANWLRVHGNKGLYTQGELRAGKLRSSGDTQVDGRLTASTMLPTTTAVCAATCTPNGIIARTASGAALSCELGRWRGYSCGGGSGNPSTPGPGYGCLTCPAGYTAHGDLECRHLLNGTTIACPPPR